MTEVARPRVRAAWASDQKPSASAIAWLVTPALLATLFLVTSAVLWADRGLDLGDESYVLSLMAGPAQQRSVGEPFLMGPFLYPIHEFLGGDIARLRLLSLCVLGLSAAWLTLEVLATSPALGLPAPHRHFRLLAAMASIGVSTVAVQFSPRVPNYRSLALMGLILCAIGLCRALRGSQGLAAAIAALGTAIASMGKVTTALAILVGLPLAAWLSGLASRRLGIWYGSFLIMALGACLGVCQLGPVAALDYLAVGIELHKATGGYASLRGFIGLTQQPWIVAAILVLPIVALWSVARLLERTLLRRWPIVAATLPVLAMIGVLAVEANRLSGAFPREGSGAPVATGLMALGIAALVLSFVTILRGANRTRSWNTGKRRLGVLTLTLLSGPYIYALGSNAPFFEQMAQAAVFWLAAVALLATAVENATRALSRLSTLAMVGLAPATLVAIVAFNDGGQHSIRAASVPTRVGGGTLLLPNDTAEAMSALAAIRVSAEITSDVPVVDQTGLAPGYQYQLGGRPLGRPYFFGSFLGARSSAAAALSRVSCSDIRQAWVLAPLDSSRAIVDFPSDCGPKRGGVERGYIPPTQWPTSRTRGVRVISPPDASFFEDR